MQFGEIGACLPLTIVWERVQVGPGTAKGGATGCSQGGADPCHPALVQARRNAVVVALLLLHGRLRVGELVALKVGNVEVSDRKGQVTVRYGKGGRRRIVLLSADARRAVRAWLVVRPEQGVALFYGKGGQPQNIGSEQDLCSMAAPPGFGQNLPCPYQDTLSSGQAQPEDKGRRKGRRE